MMNSLSLFALLVLAGNAIAFTVSSRASSCVHKMSGMAQPRPAFALYFSRDSEYYRRLQEAARDPAAFERFVMASNSTETDTSTSSRRQPTATPVASNKASGGGTYQRVEDWNSKHNGNAMSWEEKVQFDGQRFGNQVRQDEILRHNLNTF